MPGIYILDSKQNLGPAAEVKPGHLPIRSLTMASHERRNSVALDDAYLYCRKLQAGIEPPTLFRLCNAIGTLDLALGEPASTQTPVALTKEAWQTIRDSLFDMLVSGFAGQFMIYPTSSNLSNEWPLTGVIEFYPEETARKYDCYSGTIERMNPAIVTILRWKVAQEDLRVIPEDFSRQSATDEVLNECEAKAANSLLMKFYEICEEQASEGKKKAHRKWWQLYWEADSCPDKHEKHELRKQMVALQSIWGRPQD